MIIAVDFDKTLCDSEWPNEGPENPAICEYVRHRKNQYNDTIILWTCRTGDPLARAVQWCKDHDIQVDYINENTDEVREKYGESRKVFADIYIDDKALFVDI